MTGSPSVASASFDFMFPSRLDTAVLASLVEMGGEELRLQLLADLRACEDGLKTLCCLSPETATGTTPQTAHLLHTLRGIAMTIGAATLVQSCIEAENLGHAVGRAALVQSLVAVLQECALVRAQIEQCPDVNA
ncbi:MAG: Hpt domain-containing protein [Natronohydrobacter sp.]|nr:Hpt domain-containing protein [Natronohydrobacter sp.]